MHIILAGPTLTESYKAVPGLGLDAAPPGQTQTPVAPLALELHRCGHQVTVVTLDASITTAIRISSGGLALHYLPRRVRSGQCVRDLFAREVSAMAAELQNLAPDIVHAHWTYEYAEAGRRSGLPLLVTAHDSPWAVLWHFRDLYRSVRFVMAARTVFRLKHLSVVTPYMAPHMRALGYSGKIHVIPNGLDLAQYGAGKLKPHGREGITEDAPVIVTVGSTDRLRNVETSLRAFAMVRKMLPGAELHLFGHGLDRHYASGHPGVTGHGAVPHSELLAFHRERTTLLVHPSWTETFGVAVIEAMATGIPVIAGKSSGGIPHVFGEKLSGCLVDIGSPEQVAEMALRLLEDAGLYSGISALCRDNVVSRFAIRDVAGRYLALYGEISGEDMSGAAL